MNRLLTMFRTGLKPAFYVSEAGDGVRELKQ